VQQIGRFTPTYHLVEACREGPFGARVADVSVGEAEDDGSIGFTPRPTL